MHSDDLRWRIVSLIHVCDVDVHFISNIFGNNPRRIQRWCKNFLKTGTTRDNLPSIRSSRWPPEVIIDAKKHVKAYPTFYIE